jgi:hypothetical protein
MRRLLLLAAFFAASSTVTIAQDMPADRTAAWSRYLGEWRAHDLQGAPGRARVTWRRGTGPHLLLVDTYLASPDKPEEKIYDGVLFWHPGRQAWVMQQFSAWGSIYDGTVTLDEKGMTYDWASFENGVTKHYRQSLTWLDADTYSWKVEQETPSGWKQEHAGLWKRAVPQR